jgi:hypothetical protein
MFSPIIKIMPISQTQAREQLKILIDTYHHLSDEQKLRMSEADVVHHFINDLLEKVLGWPKDPQHYKYELHTAAGRPDITFVPDSGGKIFVEAKKFGVIAPLKEAYDQLAGSLRPGQLSLPGMATDRSKEEQQAINYAFAEGSTWAILTNFEKLRLFNARRDWLVLDFEDPASLLKDFDLLWQLAYENILNGSLDTLSNQRLSADIDTTYLNFINEWRERLAQNVIERRAQNGWIFNAAGEPDLLRLRAVVQRVIDRLVIVRFAEDHLVIPAGTLYSLYEVGLNNLYVTISDMLNNFFRKFDETHNSALFAMSDADRVSFDQKTLLELLDKLYQARYRSMPADIMGNTYEQYLGKTLVVRDSAIRTSDNLETRKKQGSYYTPQVIVRYLVDHSLGRYLYGTENGKPDGTPIPGEARKTSAEIADLRILDSACGSGSFLIYAYEVLADFYQAELDRLSAEAERLNAPSGNLRPSERITLQMQVAPLRDEMARIENYPRLILESHLYGVDLDPQAAEIAVVNLMMRGMERRQHEKRLPLLLNQNIKVGNGLVGTLPLPLPAALDAAKIAEVRRLRQELINTPHGARHDQVITELEAATAALTAPLNAALAPHFADLAPIRPFHWGVEFPEAFFDEHGQPLPNPGFTIIIGNPPWEILKPDLREFYAQFDARIESQFTRAQAEKRIAELQAEDPLRQAAYDAVTRTVAQTAAWTRSSGSYTRQGRGDPATQKLFIERMYGLLGHDGRLGYIVPSGIYTDLGTKDLREMLLNEGCIDYIYSFSNERFFFPGVDHRFKFALVGAQKGRQSDGFWSVFRFNPRVAVRPDDLPEFLANRDNLIYMRRDMIQKFSPDSLSVMEFQEPADYEIAEKIYTGKPVLGAEIPDKWNAKFSGEFHITNDRQLFNTEGRGLPLYDGSMFHQYDAFFGKPTFWLEENAAAARLAEKYEVAQADLEYLKPRLAYRGIARSTDTRTLFATILPPRVFSEGRTATTLLQNSIQPNEQFFLLGCLNSLMMDWVLRQKVAANVNMYHIYQLPVPRLTTGDPFFDALVPRAARLTCTRPEFADLWQSVMGEAWDAGRIRSHSGDISAGVSRYRGGQGAAGGALGDV